MNIDLAPTFLDLSSLTPPTEMDGQSIAPLLHQTHRASATERPGILIEHQGEYRQTVKGCPQYTNQGLDVSFGIDGCLMSRFNNLPDHITSCPYYRGRISVQSPRKSCPH